MKPILFATTNKGKLREVRAILGMEVEGVGLEIPEIQSLDTKEVAVQKAKDYYQQLKKPILVEDLALTFNARKRRHQGSY